MVSKSLIAATGSVLVMGVSAGSVAQQQADEEDADVRMLVSRLNLEQYKSTLKGLTQFGDRRQGTKRNHGDKRLVWKLIQI